MTPVRFGYWLGVGCLSVAVMVGCRHSRRVICCVPCDCCEVTQPVPAKVQPTTPTPTAVRDMLPGYEKKDERPNVAYRVVAPGSSPGASDLVGTDEMTAADADKVSIRPGHTPGALWIPTSHDQPIVEKPLLEKPVAKPVLEQPQTIPIVDQAAPTTVQDSSAPQQPVTAPEAQTPELKKPETTSEQ